MEKEEGTFNLSIRTGGQASIKVGDKEFKGSFFELRDGMVLVNGMVAMDLYPDRQVIELSGSGTLVTDKKVIIYGKFEGKIESKEMVMNGQMNGTANTGKLVINSEMAGVIMADQVYDHRPEEK